MSKLQRLIAVHDYLRDKIWAFVTSPNPPAEKLLLVPRTDEPANKCAHRVDDAFVTFKNRVQVIERYALFTLFWMFAAACGLLVLAQVGTWIGLL